MLFVLISACIVVGAFCIGKAFDEIKYHVTLDDSKVIKNELVTLIADGGCGKDTADYTEETSDMLISDGFTRIKIDLHLSENKEWICIKDEDISSVTNGSGKISSMTYYEALKYNLTVGENKNNTLMTAEQLIEYCVSNGLLPTLYFHDYDEEAMERLLGYLSESGVLDETTFASNKVRTLKYLRKINPSVSCWLVVDTVSSKAISLCRKNNYIICFNGDIKENTREKIASLENYEIESVCYNAEKLKTIEKFYKFGVRKFVTHSVKPGETV